MTQPLDNVVKWAPVLMDVLRQAGVPEREIPTATAVSLSLLHFESRGNPSARHDRTGAYGLTQQLKKWHPQHVGNPRAHLLHYATRYRANTKPTGPTAGNPQSFLQAWASGPPALRAFIESGAQTHSRVFQQLRNVQRMVSGDVWRAYSQWTHGWILDGQKTRRGPVEDGTVHELALPDVRMATALASPSTGYLVWGSKKRKIGERGPGGAMDVMAGTAGSDSQTRVGFILAGLLAAVGLLAFWGNR
jgi:hypothetical protein